MIQPATIREIHRICREWQDRPLFVSSRPAAMKRIPTWVALLASTLLLVAFEISSKVPLHGWPKLSLLLVTLLMLVVCLLYLLASGVMDAIPLISDVKEIWNPFPPSDDKELESRLELLQNLSRFGDSDLLFVAHSLEIKSKGFENIRTAFFGIGSLVFVILGILITHRTALPVDLSKYAWISLVWDYSKIGLVIFAAGVVIGTILGITSVWLQSSASANRALLLRRVVDDRTSLT